MRAGSVRLFYQPEGRLRLEAEDRCWLSVRPAWASPLTNPGRYLGLLDGKGKEILMATQPESEFTPEAWEIIQQELKRRYLNGVVHRVLAAKNEFGSTYWTVVTDRGERDFVTQSLQENAQWLGPNHLLLIDTDGNRFEIPDVTALDATSQELIAMTV